MLVLLSLILLLVILVYIYKYNSSDEKSVPGLRPQLYYGNFLQTGIASHKNSMANALLKFQQDYGDIFQFHYFSTRIFVFNTVEHVQEIYKNRHLLERFDLFYKNGKTVLSSSLIGVKNDEWKRHARIVEPLLKRNALVQYRDQILKCTDELIEIWTRKTNSNNLQTEVINQCQQLLLKIMLSISYGEEDNERLMNALSECNKCSSWSIFNGLNAKLISSCIHYFSPKYHSARQQLQDLIDKPRTNGEQSKCLLQSLARSPLSSKELLDEMLLINTGVDGVSTTLSWFIYYMSRYPEVQGKIKSELRQYSAPLTNEIIDQLQYIDLVIKEILRHSPVIDMSIRTIVYQGNNKIDIGGISLCSGDSIAVAVSNLHHDQRYWQIDPSLFYPERFLEDDKDHHAYAYLPFGLGHYRSCPGKHFALYQLKVICARLMQMVTFTDSECQDSNNGIRVKDGGFASLTNLAVYIEHDEENQHTSSKWAMVLFYELKTVIAPLHIYLHRIISQTYLFNSPVEKQSVYFRMPFYNLFLLWKKK